ncbi:unnamed protein product [Cuscuta epithymum]|uniref:Retrotransposon gag domain-containing protein n=1 Tax=Cuscuta epithymum TaxID=186058 RepID=A0AAV0G065_9ASTE|nr:unnamed protein product [Cuscuta epithymum]
MIDGTIQVSPAYFIDVLNRQIPNPEFSLWLRLDQTIRSWLFATLSRDVLIDVRDLKHSFEIWERLESRFMSASLARSMELKRLLSQLKKKPDQSMDNYLREIKILVDDLATINCPVPPREVLKTTIMGLGPEYESLFTTVSLFPQHFPFETLRNHLLELEQRVIYLRSQEQTSVHQAFDAHIPQPGVQAGQPHGNQQQSGQQSGAQQVQQRPPGSHQRGRGGRGRGGRGRGGRGRWGREQQPVPYGSPAGWYPTHAPPQFYASAGSYPAAGGASHTGTVFCNSSVSHLNINALSVCDTNRGSADLSPARGILGSVPPPVVCQICFSAGHSAITCPSRFQQPSAPALLITPGESNSALWYPDSGASTHMTASEGQSLGGSTSASYQ